MIKIDDKYGIDVSDNNYTLVRYRVSEKTGEEQIQPIGYYNSMERACAGYVAKVDYDLFSGMNTTLDEAMKAFRSHREKISAVLSSVFGYSLNTAKTDNSDS